MVDSAHVADPAPTRPGGVSVRYLAVLLASLFIPLLAVMIVNIVVDPFLYRWPRPAGWPAPLYLSFDRELHLNLVAHAKPRSLLLGNSQTQHGIVPSHWAAPSPVINGAAVGADLLETYRTLAVAESNRPVSAVILGLDFTSSRRYPGSKPVTNMGYVLAPNGGFRIPMVGSLLSWTMLRSSMMSVNAWRHDRQDFGEQGEARDIVYSRTVADHGGPRAALSGRFRQYAANLSAPPRDFSTELKAVRDLACAHGTKLTVYLTPLHVLWIEALDDTEKHADWEAWKRAIVSASADRPQCPFTVWDFNTFNPVTTEALPAASSREPLVGSWDGVHFRTSVGDRILARMNGGDGQDGFGVRLTPSTIDAALTRDRAAAARYRQQQPNAPRPSDILRDSHSKS